MAMSNRQKPRDLIKTVGNTEIYVSQGDITQVLTESVIIPLNSGGMWTGGVNAAIQRVAGNHYHDQLAAWSDVDDLQTIVATGSREYHKGEFDNVVFVIDDVRSPLNQVVYNGLEAASNEGYQSVVLPTIRMGEMLGEAEKTPEEAVRKMGKGVRNFMDKYGSQTPLKDLRFVVYNDQATADMLSKDLTIALGKWE